jgi:hypothetical protein
MARAFGFICMVSLASLCLPSTLSGQTTQRPTESASALVEQFESTTIFWKQFEVAEKIVALHDKSVLEDLEPWLSNEDMHLRGNAAFIFASLGDERGFQVIKSILEDLSTKRVVVEIDSTGRPSRDLDAGHQGHRVDAKFSIRGNVHQHVQEGVQGAPRTCRSSSEGVYRAAFS